MNKRVTILLLLFLTSIPALFAQTVENKKRIDVQSKSSVNAGEQLLNTEHIKPELPDEVNKNGVIKKELSSSSEIAPVNSSQGLSPFFYAYPMIMKNIPILTDFYRFQQNRIYKQFSFVGSGQKVSYIGLGEYIQLMALYVGCHLKDCLLTLGECSAASFTLHHLFFGRILWG